MWQDYGRTWHNPEALEKKNFQTSKLEQTVDEGCPLYGNLWVMFMLVDDLKRSKKKPCHKTTTKMVLVVDDAHNQFSLVLSSLSATLSSVWQYNSCINGYSVWIHSHSLSLSWPVVILYGAYARYIANWSDCLFGRPLLHRRDRRGPWMGDRCSSVVASLSIQLIFPYPLSVRLFLEFSNSFKLRLLSYRSNKKINDQNTRNEVK